MGTYKLLLEDTIGYDFDLIAVHCAVEEYQMAFLLNKHLKLKFHRAAEDLSVSFKEICAYFPIYHYEDQRMGLFYDLICNQNKSKDVGLSDQGGLFGTTIAAEINIRLLPELKNVDYFLKVSTDGVAFAKANTLAILNKIPQIVTAYTVAIDQLKTKENLIFE